MIIRRKSSCDCKKAGFAAWCGSGRGDGEGCWWSLCSHLIIPVGALDKDCGEGSAVLQINCYLLSFSKWGAHTP